MLPTFPSSGLPPAASPPLSASSSWSQWSGVAILRTSSPRTTMAALLYGMLRLESKLNRQTHPMVHIRARYLLSNTEKFWSRSFQCNPFVNLRLLRDAPNKKKRDYLGIFPKCRTPPPPLLGTPVSKKKVWFILPFRSFGAFLVFTKMFTFW